jgi:hypothetical protein
MKIAEITKAERDGPAAVKNLLQALPRVDQIWLEMEPSNGNHYARPDFIAHFNFSGQPFTAVCEVKNSGQPRYVREAINQLVHYISKSNDSSIPIVVAPFLSDQSRELCREAGIGYLDFEGNALIDFGTVYIERGVPSQPKPERRALRSLFKPKSARVLRTLLRDPNRPWRVTELSEKAEVSVGHVSTIGNALRDRDWAKQQADGLVLSDPDALLDAWIAEYEPPEGEQISYYTHLHGDALAKAINAAMTNDNAGRVILASYSAAAWLAPYGRNPNTYFYADKTGLDRLASIMPLSSGEKGGNLNVRILKEDGIFKDAVHPTESIICTSPVQTYLDLTHSGERAQEAAGHLRSELLTWQ